MALASALWLGILTSLSPCPMATNIAAVSFVSKRLSSARHVFITGILYTLGRSLTYLVLGVLLSSSLLAAPHLSHLLQKHMNQLLGPVLILVGMILVELIQVRSRGTASAESLQKKVEVMGIWGAPLLGVVFAASFCPISAAFFFGSVLPLTLRANSRFLVPLVYGVGTGIPVLVFAVLIGAGGKKLGKAFTGVAAFEKWARLATGSIFILVGIYYCLTYIFGFSLW
ncbi:MAG: aromatic aminobenezylarsenical efflux permease ArsG family transporter [Kiritimatiellia bacterium]|nr:aromatic aminobenezylarsenical efflux permease ArsG family transporter [Kiritimatiellia bacterium]MDP6847330.1 aromatic aminobenezylarsenical efflux permease ArsG family transporter [Kiritimatiellia bacterium]